MLKKLTIALTALALMTAPVMAHGSKGFGHAPHFAPRFVPHYAPQFRHNPAPWIGLGIGALVIGTIWYNAYGQRCWQEQVTDPDGNRLYNSLGEPITQVVCR